jgi:hypothetical protein
MGSSRNIGFTIKAPHPVDSRLKVSTYSGLFNIAVVYEGLITYVADENADYRYIGGSWIPYTYGFSSTILGEPAGSSVILNIVHISQVDHDQAVIDTTLIATTAYIIKN